jgi:hypothetical protein
MKKADNKSHQTGGLKININEIYNNNGAIPKVHVPKPSVKFQIQQP